MADYSSPDWVKEYIELLGQATKSVDGFITAQNKLGEAVNKNIKIKDADTAATKKETAAKTELGKLEKQREAATKKLIALDSRQAKELAIVKTKIQEKNKQTKQEIQLGKVAKDSLAAQRIELIKLTEKYVGASKASQGKLAPAIKQLSNNIKEQESAIGNNTRKVGGYEDALATMPGRMGGVVNGFVGMTKAAFAFIMTPIGAVIAALVGAFKLLQAVFKNSQPLMDAFSVASKAIGAALSVVLDRVTQFFENLRGGEVTLKSIGEAILKNIINRFAAAGGYIKAIALAFKGEFKEAAQQAKTAAIQMATGLDAVQQSKVAETLKGITKEIKEETAAASELEQARNKLRDEEIASIQTLALLDQALQKNRLEAKDQTKSDEERLASLKAASSAEVESTNIRVRLAEERARILQSERDLGKSTAEEIREAEEASAAAIEARTNSYRTQQRILSELSGFEKTIAAEREKNAQAMVDEIDAEYEAEMELELLKDSVYEDGLERDSAELEAAQDKADELLAIELDRIAQEISANEELKNIKADIANELFSFGQTLSDRRIANLEKEVDSEGNITAAAAEEIAKIRKRQATIDKAQALFNIGVNTAQAITKAGAQLGAFALPVQIGLGVLGAVQAATVLATPLPEFKDGVRNFGGGMAVVGDGGESELVRNPDGTMWMTPDTPTATYLQKGSDVLNQKQINNEFGADFSILAKKQDETNELLRSQSKKKTAQPLTDKGFKAGLQSHSFKENTALKLQGK